MYSRFTIKARLSAVEAQRILETLVQPRRFVLKSDPAARDLRPFAGHIEGASFKIQRVISGRNSFLPVIVGRVAAEEGGAAIRGHMRLAIPVAIVMSVWMGVTLAAAVRDANAVIAAHTLTNGSAIVLLPLFGVVLIAVGYYPERRKALRLLLDAFADRGVAASRHE